MSNTIQQQQQQLILRLPEVLADHVRELIHQNDPSHADKQYHSYHTIDIKPLNELVPSNDFIFILEQKEYPALLTNLPTIVESHKTFDNKIFLKSGDIGQMLEVFLTVEDKENVKSKLLKTNYGDSSPNGLTPPTFDIIKRRFELTKKNGSNDKKQQQYAGYRIRQTIDDINTFNSFLQTSQNNNTGGNRGTSQATNSSVSKLAYSYYTRTTSTEGIASSTVANTTTTLHASNLNRNITTSSQQQQQRLSITDSQTTMVAAPTIAPMELRKNNLEGELEVVMESIIEEIVDFEEWMIDPLSNNKDVGITATLHDDDWSASEALLFIQHPEILITEEDQEEEELDTLSAATQQQQSQSNTASTMNQKKANNGVDSSKQTTVIINSTGNGVDSSKQTTVIINSTGNQESITRKEQLLNNVIKSKSVLPDPSANVNIMDIVPRSPNFNPILDAFSPIVDGVSGIDNDEMLLEEEEECDLNHIDGSIAMQHSAVFPSVDNTMIVKELTSSKSTSIEQNNDEEEDDEEAAEPADDIDSDDSDAWMREI